MNKMIFVLMSILLLASCSENVSKNNVKEEKSSSQVTNVAKSEVESLTESIASDSLNVELYIQRARVNLANEKISSAIKDINAALSLDRKNIDAHLVLADVYYALGDDDNILLTLNKACEYAPLDSRPIVKLSELSFLQGNVNLANAYIDKALELDRFNPRAYFMRAMIALSVNDTVVAMKNFMTARIQDESFIEPKIQIAHIYAAQNDTLAAKAFFEEAIMESPDDLSLKYDYALYLQDNGYPEQAILYYDTLLCAVPNHPDCIYNKGYVNLVYLGDNEKALECFNKVLEINPKSVNALFNKGRTYEQMGDYINAKSIYLQILKSYPDYKLAVDAVNRINE
ncbi:MAG: tetratricopeptide repeat protein [Bacteroidales bacterium]|nr:tetratricopeptide repeat protein [Bacteroidales bacterium]